MQLVYNGAHPEVVVDELDQYQVIKAGEPVEIPDDLAARLLEQSTWARADKGAIVPSESPEQKAAREKREQDEAAADVAAKAAIDAQAKVEADLAQDSTTSNAASAAGTSN